MKKLLGRTICKIIMDGIGVPTQGRGKRQHRGVAIGEARIDSVEVWFSLMLRNLKCVSLMHLK